MDNLKINIKPEWVEKEDEGGVTIELQNVLNFKVKGIKDKDDWDALKQKIDSLVAVLNTNGTLSVPHEDFIDNCRQDNNTVVTTEERLRESLEKISKHLGISVTSVLEEALKNPRIYAYNAGEIEAIHRLGFPLSKLASEMDGTNYINPKDIRCTREYLQGVIIYSTQKGKIFG